VDHELRNRATGGFGHLDLHGLYISRATRSLRARSEGLLAPRAAATRAP
jgi:hypothetical protein